MKADGALMAAAQKNTDLCESQIQDLIELLLRQITLARQGKIEQVEILAVKSGELVKNIANTGVSHLRQAEHLNEQVKSLYGELSMILADWRSRTTEEIKEIRQGRRMIRAYRRGV